MAVRENLGFMVGVGRYAGSLLPKPQLSAPQNSPRELLYPRTVRRGG